MTPSTCSRAASTCSTTVICGRGRLPMPGSSSARTRTFSTSPTNQGTRDGSFGCGWATAGRRLAHGVCPVVQHDRRSLRLGADGRRTDLNTAGTAGRIATRWLKPQAAGGSQRCNYRGNPGRLSTLPGRRSWKPPQATRADCLHGTEATSPPARLASDCSRVPEIPSATDRTPPSPEST